MARGATGHVKETQQNCKRGERATTIKLETLLKIIDVRTKYGALEFEGKEAMHVALSSILHLPSPECAQELCHEAATGVSDKFRRGWRNRNIPLPREIGHLQDRSECPSDQRRHTVRRLKQVADSNNLL